MYLKPGASNGVVIHGGIWAPHSYVSLGNIAQSANGQFLGGLVVARLGTQAAASAGSFNLKVPTQPVTKRLIVRSTAGTVTTSVVALVRSAPSTASAGSIVIQSWRVE
jgi:hypothetical protein